MTKISVDKKTCIGCGACESVCPKTFKLENGKAQAINSEVKEITCEKNAESSCPVNAISITE